ncbi:fatty acid desaturase, partial [Pseudomonas sp. FSL R10-1339]|uniref:fatty acid desaturase n=1 Tax=Pseudomonas sp. FSL R10-1339 TaxID=2662196 RepID=UPI002113F34C
MNTDSRAPSTTLPKTEQDLINDVTQKITQHSNELRKRYRVLGFQNAIGASVMAVSVTGMIITGTLYIKGLIPGWLCIVINALLTSFIHELEHDLIHRLYFRKHPVAHNLMMLLCWIARPGMPSPWLRRELHFHHHKESGTDTDVEAWITTSGSKWGAKRFLKLIDGFVFGIVNALIAPTWQEKIRLTVKVLRLNAPMGLLYWGCWYIFLGYHLYTWVNSLMGLTVELSAAASLLIQVVNAAVVIIVAPNIIRQFCLFFISSKEAPINLPQPRSKLKIPLNLALLTAK